MTKNNVDIAHTYYTAVGEKRLDDVKKYIHSEIRFSAPLAKIKGKEEFLTAVQNFINFFKNLQVRTTFGSEDQVLVVYDVDCPEPIGKIPTSALMTFQEGLIIGIELFYDGRPFEKR